MRKQQPTSSPEPQIDDSVFVVEGDECTRVFLNEAEARTAGVESGGEFRPIGQVPSPSSGCVWSKDARTWQNKLYGGTFSELYAIEEEDGILDLYLDLEDAIRCQSGTERDMIEHVVLNGEGFRLADVEDHPDAMLSDAAKSAYEEYLTKQAAELACPQTKNCSGKTRRVKSAQKVTK